MTFTIDDVTMRVVSVQTSANARQMRIVLSDAQGRLVREITPTPNTVDSVIVDAPARLVEIQKADATTKSYIAPFFTVYF